VDIFDKRLESLHGYGLPYKIKDALVHVHDTLDSANIIAVSIFKDKATPEIALSIYDRIQSLLTEYKKEYELEMESLIHKDDD
jgi:hypothetical protein